MDSEVLNLDSDIERITEDEGEAPDDEKEDTGRGEEENDERKVVKPKKRVLRPRPKLDVYRLTGPRGIGVLKSACKKMQLKGNNHETRDLNVIISCLEHWAHRLFPKMSFDDCLEKIEDLGSKQAVKVNVTKIRLDMVEEFENEKTDLTEDANIPEKDPFDDLVKTHQPVQTVLTDEQRERMLRNRQIAEERRMARLKKIQEKASNIDSELVLT